MSAPEVTPQATVTVHLDQRSPLRRIWRYVGYDEPNYTYTPHGHALLAKLADMSDGPYYVRCHFILCSGDGTPKLKWGSTNVYTEDEDGNPVYSWDIDRQDSGQLCCARTDSVRRTGLYAASADDGARWHAL